MSNLNGMIWTVGHSTRSTEDLLSLLRSYDIQAVADVRTVPRSRTNPQFNKDVLEKVLPESGIEYLHLKELGGLRKPRNDSPNMGWHNDGFRGYADYMQTSEFDAALHRLIDIALIKRVVLMCAEALPWRCHRSLIADALTIRGFTITDIFDERKSQPHKLTPFAVVEGEKISYPSAEASQLDLE